jgi:hypothetical protein
MKANTIASDTEAIGDSLKRSAAHGLTALVAAIRVVLYAVLAVLRPFIVAGLSALTLVGLAASLFYALLVPMSHFPVGLVLMMSVASAVSIVLFYALMEFLLPQ